VPDAAFDIAAHTTRPAPCTRKVREGDRLDLGDRSFEVLHLPGHSPGSIGLWEEDSGVLFSGDAVYDGGLLTGFPGADSTTTCARCCVCASCRFAWSTAAMKPASVGSACGRSPIITCVRGRLELL
jgi:hypothetical protein